jgi:hypothetical protein
MLRFASFHLCVASTFASVSGCHSPPGEYAEVFPQDSFVVMLSEKLAIPVGELSDRVILADQQYFLISQLDSEGRELAGQAVPELGLSPGLKPCDGEPASLEHHCISIGESGSHALEVGVGDETLILRFEAVSVNEIVGIELLQPDEEELLPGTWVYIDVVGVTEDGTHVASIHPRFEVGEASHVGYFAYQYDPDSRPQTLDIEALGWHTRTSFRGISSGMSKPDLRRTAKSKPPAASTAATGF